MTSPWYSFVGVARRESWKDRTSRPWNFEAEFPLGSKGLTPVELLIDSAVGLLLNLEAAQQGRSMLFSGEQNLLLKETKKGSA